MKHVLTLLIVAVLATSSFAQASLAQEDAAKKKKKKGGQVAWQVKRTKRSLKDLSLTTEQETAFDQAAEKLTAELAALEKKGLTQEMRKARSEKLKAGRESGLKGKELKAHPLEGLSAEEVELFENSDKHMAAFQTAVAKLLTDEQLKSLPEKAQKKMKMLAREKGSKGSKGRKKKKAADESEAAE
jgi:Spy/CpxP family protein refolding chaperone